MSPAEKMVEAQLRRRGIHDPRVLDAMRRIPRDRFVPPDEQGNAWKGAALPIGFGQTITHPYLTALMAEQLQLKGTEKVLEVGTGCGYHSAVLAQLAREVISIERIPELAQFARENLERAGLGERVKIVVGDGTTGFPKEAPYDAISVAAAAPQVPSALLEQLRDPGTLVIPVGDRANQDLLVIQKQNGEMTTRIATACRFVPLIGEKGWQEEE